MEEVKLSDRELSTETQEDTLPEGKVLYITPETKHVDYRALLGQVVQYVSMGDVLAKIKAGTQYVVQIPAKFQAAYEAGELHMMQNKASGIMRPFLVKIEENGKHTIVCNLPVVEQAFVQGNPVQDIAYSYHNILMQQQMARLTATVEETYRKVKRIEHGQMDDRIGRLEAGKNGLLLALSMPDGDEKTMQINSSRQNVLVAQAQIGQALQRRAAEFQALPKTALGRFSRELVHSGYLSGKDKEVSEMQEYYDLYLQATKLVAASYAMGGDLKTAEESFRIGEQFMSSIDFRKVQSIGRVHKGLNDMFYTTPTAYITQEKEICLEEAKTYDTVALEVSGEELLGGIK